MSSLLSLPNVLSYQSPRHVAVIGGGMSGLAVAFSLLRHSNGRVSVTVFDPAPPGTVP